MCALTFKTTTTIAGNVARLIVDDSSLETIITIREGNIIPLLSHMDCAATGGRLSCTLFYNPTRQNILIKYDDGTEKMFNALTKECYDSLIDAPTLIAKLVTTPILPELRETTFGNYIDPGTLQLQQLTTRFSIRERNNLPEGVAPGGEETNVIVGETITPPGLFGGDGVRVSSFHTRSSPRGNTAPITGSLYFEPLGTGMTGSIMEWFGAGYTILTKEQLYRSDEHHER